MADAPSRAALARADRLMSLREHPAFETLIEEATLKAVRNEKSLTARAKSEEGVPHEVWRYWAGFEAGMEYLLNLPENAQKKLQKFTDPAGSET